MLLEDETGEDGVVWIPEHVLLTVHQELSRVRVPSEAVVERIATTIRRKYPDYPATDRDLQGLVEREAQQAGRSGSR